MNTSPCQLEMTIMTDNGGENNDRQTREVIMTDKQER